MVGFSPLTTFEELALVALWCAGIYRLVVTYREPWFLWRASFTTAMLLIPAGTTAHFYRAQVGAALGIPNSGGLIAHVCFAAAAACVAIYVDTLKQDQPRPGRVAMHVAIGAGTILIIVVTWLMAPIHVRELPGLSRYSTHPAVAAYSLVFYTYLGMVLVVVIAFCARETRGAGRTALPKTVSLTLIGLGCVVGLPVLATFAAMAAVTALAGRGLVFMQNLVLVAAGAAPWSLGLIAAGVLSLAILPTLSAYFVVQSRWRRLRPLWEDLVFRQPDVRLRLPTQPMDLLALREREQRAVIEIHDALQRIVVPAGRGEGVEALARSLANIPNPSVLTHEEGCAASEVLTPACDHQGDLDQLLALAQAWTHTRHGGRLSVHRLQR